LLAFGYLWTIRRFPTFPHSRRPVMSLIVLMLVILGIARIPVTGLPYVMLTAGAMAFSQYLWFFAYWVSENASAKKPLPAHRVGFWRPFWGSTAVPYGKGAAYLEKVEAKNDEQFAATQWSGMKLLIQAALLTAVVVLITKFVYGATEKLTTIPYASANARIPTYQMALDAMRDGHPYPWRMRWIALTLYFAVRVLTLMIFGHKVIAIARMAGFHAFRNTWRPFSAPSVAEFYNRIYYYFKELLVAFFFFPTYLRYFKHHPKLRLFAATLAAAGVGNFLFHFLRDSEYVLRWGFGGALRLYASYAVYAMILGTVIALSQMRVLAHTSHKKDAPAAPIYRRVLAVGAVLVFYCMISAFEEPNVHHNLGDYVGYLMYLFRP
jgi:hypothetical protein